ncbi:MAG: phosphoribosylanthranilate isomerase [Desulfuromonadales bacterium]|nr:phosphoribosylanthranilate isomerase [Desulfuromonadales bacterium]
MVKVKICGITTLEDALTAIEAGADALGFVFYSRSPRHVSPEQAADIIRALPPFVQTVGLFVNEEISVVNATADRCGLDIIQLHGEETPEYCESVLRRVIKAFRVKDITTLDALARYHVSGCLLDAWSPAARGGTGQIFNWEIAAEAVKRGHRIILAGGLTPENIAGAVATVNPYAVDVSSGVESAPGKKDATLIRAFIEAARQPSRNPVS